MAELAPLGVLPGAVPPPLAERRRRRRPSRTLPALIPRLDRGGGSSCSLPEVLPGQGVVVRGNIVEDEPPGATATEPEVWEAAVMEWLERATRLHREQMHDLFKALLEDWRKTRPPLPAVVGSRHAPEVVEQRSFTPPECFVRASSEPERPQDWRNTRPPLLAAMGSRHAPEVPDQRSFTPLGCFVSANSEPERPQDWRNTRPPGLAAMRLAPEVVEQRSFTPPDYVVNANSEPERPQDPVAAPSSPCPQAVMCQVASDETASVTSALGTVLSDRVRATDTYRRLHEGIQKILSRRSTHRESSPSMHPKNVNFMRRSTAFGGEGRRKESTSVVSIVKQALKADCRQAQLAAGGPVMETILQRPSARLFFSRGATMLFLTFAMLNLVCSAMQGSLLLNDVLDGGHRIDGARGRWSYIGEAVCYAVFVVQVIWRLAVMRRQFFGTCLWRRNAVDVAVALGSSLYFLTGAVPNLCIFRSFNALYSMTFLDTDLQQRSIRIVFKLEQVFWGSIPSLLSTIAFMFCIVFLFTYLFSYAVYRVVAQAGSEEVPELPTHFDSFTGTFMILFMTVSGGINWILVYDSLRELSEGLGMLFVLYVACMNIGVLNIVTGLFVDVAMQLSELNRHQRVEKLKASQAQFAEKLRQIFKEADSDDSGTLNWPEFSAHLGDTEVSSYLFTLGLDVAELDTLFRILDRDSKGHVDIDDFIWGCVRMEGPAKSVDLCTVLFEQRQLQKSMQEMVREIDTKLTDLQLGSKDLGAPQVLPF